MRSLIYLIFLCYVGQKGWGQGRLTVNSSDSTGQIAFGNHLFGVVDAPVFNTDCQTRLLGPVFVAEVYAGFTPDSLQALGPILPFKTGLQAGYVSFGPEGENLRIYDVPGARSGVTVYTQLRAWDSSAGATYEAAVADGGKYGFSNIVPILAVEPLNPPNVDVGLESFCLFSGSPPKLRAAASGPNSATLSWTVPSNGFLLQQNSSLGNTNWVTVTNAISVAGTNEFKVTVSGGSTFYRLVHPEPASP